MDNVLLRLKCGRSGVCVGISLEPTKSYSFIATPSDREFLNRSTRREPDSCCCCFVLIFFNDSSYKGRSMIHHRVHSLQAGRDLVHSDPSNTQRCDRTLRPSRPRDVGSPSVYLAPMQPTNAGACSAHVGVNISLASDLSHFTLKGPRRYLLTGTICEKYLQF